MRPRLLYTFVMGVIVLAACAPVTLKKLVFPTATFSPESQCPGRLYSPYDKPIPPYPGECCPDGYVAVDKTGNGVAESCEKVQVLQIPPGTLMGWADGSTLVAIGSPELYGDPDDMPWFTMDPINNYQYSRCMAAGACPPLEDPEFQEYMNSHDPTKGNMPVQIGDPNIKNLYCMFAGGVVPPDPDVVGIIIHYFPQSKLAQSDPSSMELFCVVKHPPVERPMCRIPASYTAGPPGGPDFEIAVRAKSQFCKNKQGFATLTFDKGQVMDVKAMGEGNAMCQVVNDTSIVCYGPQAIGVQAAVTAKFQWDPGDFLMCHEPGYMMDADHPSQCQLQPGEQEKGCAMGETITPVAGGPEGAYYCMPAHPGAAKNAAPPAFGFVESEGCATGMFRSKDLNGCVGLGYKDECPLAGSTYDASMQCCMPAGDQPATCPEGYACDPTKEMCDAITHWVEGGFERQFVFVADLPACGANTKAKSCEPPQQIVCSRAGGCVCQ